MYKIWNRLMPLFFILFTLSACDLITRTEIHITKAKIVAGVDDKLMPVKITDTFPQGTTSVACWIQWKKAKVNTPLIASWQFVTDDIHILDYTFLIPRKEGMGSISLTMPQGKILPSGTYQVDLKVSKRILKSLTFIVE